MFDPKFFTAAELMKTDLVTVKPGMGIADLAQLLWDQGIHGAPVVNERGEPVGVVSQTDIAKAVAEGIEDFLPAGSFYEDFVGRLAQRDGWTPPVHRIKIRLAVQDIMSERLITASETASAGALAALMLKEMVSRVLITRKGKLVGIVAAMDLLVPLAEKERTEVLAGGAIPIERRPVASRKKKIAGRQEP